MRITILAAPSNTHRKLEAVEKKKYLEACLDQRRHISPFGVSCDGVHRNEAKVLQWYSSTTNLAGRRAKKSGKPISETTNFMKSKMSIAIVRAHLCIRGSPIPTSRMSQHPQWEDGSGLSMTYHKADNKHISKKNKRYLVVWPNEATYQHTYSCS